MKRTFAVTILIAVVGLLAASCAFGAEVKADFSLETRKALDFPALFKLKLPIIADYGSEGCGPCRKMYPGMKAVNEKYKGKAIIKFADVWKNKETAADMPLQIIPTQFFFTADGKPFVPSATLAQKYKFMLYKDKDGKHTLTAHQGGLKESDFDEILKEMGVK